MKNTTWSVGHVISAASDLVDMEAESPDIFKRGDYFYVTASNTCGFCPGTLLILYRSKSIAGPWQRQIISGDTCGGQSTGVLTLPDPKGGHTSYLHVSDLFSTAPQLGARTAQHGHALQQLTFEADGSVQDLNCSAQHTATLSFAQSNASISKIGVATTASDSSDSNNTSTPNIYTPHCNLPREALYQTWTSSASGILKSVNFNIAKNAPTGNLSATVFRYPNNTIFTSARFVWETLSTANINPSTSISMAFEVLSIPTKATVAKGDRLGVAISAMSTTSLCTLVQETGETFDVVKSERALFGNGPGQVSPRGEGGKESPVKVLEGKEIKWFAVVS